MIGESANDTLIRLLLAECLTTLAEVNRLWAHASGPVPTKKRRLALIKMETLISSLIASDIEEMVRVIQLEIETRRRNR